MFNRTKLGRSILQIGMLLTTTIVFGQNLREQAAILLDAGKFKPALELLLRYQEQKPGNLDIQRDIGIAAFHAGQFAVARQYLLGLVGKSNDPQIPLYLARTYQHEGLFKEAINEYKNFLRKIKTDDVRRRGIIADIKRCGAGRKIMLQPEEALVENLGEPVNSSFDEFAPILSPTDDERIYFSAAREFSEGGLRDEQGRSNDKTGKYTADIFSTESDNGEWGEPKPLQNALLSTSLHEYILGFRQKGKILYFFRGFTQYSGVALMDIYKAEQEQKNPAISFESPFKPQEGDNSLFFFNDTVMIFASRRAGGHGGLDLYYTRVIDGAWTEPQNMGPQINTPFDETTPFLAKDGRTLYFSSNSTQSMGGFDVFKSTYKDADMKWTEAQNLGRSINSAADDTHFQLTQDGRKGYFCSDRKEGLGGRDLYVALFKTPQKVQQAAEPTVFYEVPDYNEKNRGNVLTNSKIKYDFSPLYYDQDADVVGSNFQEIRRLTTLLNQYPSVQLVLTGHCAFSDEVKYESDLYFTLKTLEKVRKKLTDNGIHVDRISLKSVGSTYPLAQMVLEGVSNPAAVKLNKRIDLELKNLENTPILFELNMPMVAETMRDARGEQLKKHQQGLSYKVHVASTKRMFEGEVLSKYRDAMIEVHGDGQYLYTVGLKEHFAEAHALKQDLLKAGNKEATIIAYMDGVRLLSDNEIRQWSKKYPDLLKYLALKGK